MVDRGVPFLLAITGSIGMGKTATARMFAKLGIPVFDADATVHNLYAMGGAAVPAIRDVFPGIVVKGAVDRAALADWIGADPNRLGKLEQIVHPLVRLEQRRFLEQAAKDRADIAVLDIPLLYETGQHAGVDAVVVVSAPEDVQRMRVLQRPGMTPEKLDTLLARQLPDVDKRAKAQFVVETGQGLAHAFEQVKQIVAEIRECRRQGHRSA